MPAYVTATAMLDPSHICNLYHRSQQRRILNRWMRPGIEPASSWILVGFVNLWATKGTSLKHFRNLFCCLYISVQTKKAMIKILILHFISQCKPLPYIGSNLHINQVQDAQWYKHHTTEFMFQKFFTCFIAIFLKTDYKCACQPQSLDH